MRRVIAAGAALDVRDERAWTAATTAADVGSWRVLALVVDAGVDVAVSGDRDGRTALHYAAGRGCAQAVRVLLEAGFDADARDSKGLTVLWLGAHTDRGEVVRPLIRAGAVVDAGVSGEGCR
jgi:ankyrin repeat protein